MRSWRLYYSWCCLSFLCPAITVVIPYLGYSRQDRKAKGAWTRFCCGCYPHMLEQAGAHRLVIDLHSPQIQGTFHGPFDHLVAGAAYTSEGLKEEMGSRDPGKLRYRLARYRARQRCRAGSWFPLPPAFVTSKMRDRHDPSKLLRPKTPRHWSRSVLWMMTW